MSISTETMLERLRNKITNNIMNTIVQEYSSVIDTFISSLCSKYNLPVEEVRSIWGKAETSSVNAGLNNTPVPSSASTSASTSASPSQGFSPSINLDISEIRLATSTAKDLSALCKAYGIPSTGTKPVLLERLRQKRSSLEGNTTVAGSEAKAPTESSNTAGKMPSLPKPGNRSRLPIIPPVIQKFTQNSPVITLRKNVHGNLCDTNGLVFDQNKKVIGRQKDDGTVASLTDADIQICQQYKYDYKLPDNLDINSTPLPVEIPLDLPAEGIATLPILDVSEEEIVEDDEPLDED
jgi:hypothetical protein